MIKSQKEKKFINKNTIYFGILFVFFMLMHGLFHIDNWQFDSDEYWNMGQKMWVLNDQWSLYGLTSGFRGYIFPTFLSICYKIGKLFKNSHFGFWIMSSLCFAFLFSYLVNKFCICLKLYQKNKWLGLFCAIFSFVFFRGLFLYPLSDVYSFIICILTVVILCDMRVLGKKRRIASYIILGGLLYAEYNIRTIYLFPAILIALVSIFVDRKKVKIWNLIGRIGLLLSGIEVCAMPQILLNKHLFGIYSLKVPTKNLMLSQVYWGMKYNRFEGYIGKLEEYNTAQVYFIDKVGNQILSLEGIEGAFGSFGQYFHIILKYPLDIVGMFFRHLMNILYPIFPEVYIKNIGSFKGFYLVTFFTVIYISGINIWHSKWSIQKIITIVVVLLPCIFILPGAVEVRFFYPLYFLIFICAIYGIKNFIEIVRKKTTLYIMLYCFGLGGYFAGCGYMLSCIENANILM